MLRSANSTALACLVGVPCGHAPCFRAIMGQYSRALGIQAEEDAARWIVAARAARIVSSVLRNYRCKCGEIDLLFEEQLEDGGIELVFVEVRSRARGSWASALESVDWKKRRKLRRAVDFYLQKYSGPAKSVRFDILARDGGAWIHLENVRFD